MLLKGLRVEGNRLDMTTYWLNMSNKSKCMSKFPGTSFYRKTPRGETSQPNITTTATKVFRTKSYQKRTSTVKLYGKLALKTNTTWRLETECWSRQSNRRLNIWISGSLGGWNFKAGDWILESGRLAARAHRTTHHSIQLEGETGPPICGLTMNFITTVDATISGSSAL